MKIAYSLFRSSLGKKYVMAVTGIGLFGFVIVHMLGNLQIFLGAEVINAYAVFLKSKPAILWAARLILLLLVVLHIWSAIRLSVENRRARPVPYGEYKVVSASYASRTMLMSGVIIFGFVIYHLLHFTVAVPAVNLLSAQPGVAGVDFLTLKDEANRPDVYRMMILGFSSAWVSGFYIFSMALLCTHLSHGVGSMFQSLGLKNARNSEWIDRFAVGSALVIFIGNCSIPVAVLLGYGQ